MTRPQGNCPNCGAAIEFLWADAVQTVCPFCRSVLVRHDVNLERIGQVGVPPATPSPIQLRTEGRHGDDTFIVVGRIIYEYERGTWNEWHFVTNRGKSGWLSDALDEYAVTFQAETRRPLPASSEIARDQPVSLEQGNFQVTTITRAHYAGVEGELPFVYWDKSDVFFVDMLSTTGAFATIDYSEEPALLFVGEYVEFDKLSLTNLREFAGW